LTLANIAARALKASLEAVANIKGADSEARDGTGERASEASTSAMSTPWS
jgi:hypothetical protein